MVDTRSMQRKLFVALFFTVSAGAVGQPSSEQRVKEIRIIGRVLDIADSIPLFAVGVYVDPVTSLPFARTDSLGRFVFRGTTRAKSVRIRFYNGFYEDDSLFKELASSRDLDTGLTLLRRGPRPIERMVIPWCEPIDRAPERLIPGTWIERDWTSRTRVKWRLCDGYLREPRVLPRPPNTR
jgi:hypothetical protein